MGYKIDLTGRKYGKLTVLNYSHTAKRKSYWVCLCECGNTATVSGSNLNTGNTTSCGCGEARNRQKLMDSFYAAHHSHGQAFTRLHRIWAHMKERCINPNSKDFHLYGGRGISVFPEWCGKDGYAKFSKWARTHGYADNLTIDRVDTNGNYEPDNCRWSDATVQANNRRTNLMFTINGETKTLAEWCRISNVNYHTAYYRIKKTGMEPAKALNLQPQ